MPETRIVEPNEALIGGPSGDGRLGGMTVGRHHGGFKGTGGAPPSSPGRSDRTLPAVNP